MDSRLVQRRVSNRASLVGANASLLLFMVVYYCRPEDWIPGLSSIPLAKIAGFLAIVAFVSSLRDIRWPLPREVVCLGLMVVHLFLSASLSPVWRGGALQKTLGFSKVLLIVIVMVSVVKRVKHLRRLIVIHVISVAAIAALAVWRGHLLAGRLQEGIQGGSNLDSNDLALAMVIALPLCLGLLLSSSSWFARAIWLLIMSVMTYAVLLTGSRGGFISLVVVVGICLWEFGIQDRRHYLLLVAALSAVALWQSAGGVLNGRFKGTLDSKEDTAAAYSSAQQRQALFWRSIEVTGEHPVFGVGPGNFQIVSGNWHATHNSFTEMSSEGGIPALILYILILYSGFKNLGAVKRLSHRLSNSKPLAQALRASLAGYAVGAVFLSEGYQFFAFFLIAYTSVLLRIVKERFVQTPVLESKGASIVNETFRSSAATVPDVLLY